MPTFETPYDETLQALLRAPKHPLVVESEGRVGGSEARSRIEVHSHYHGGVLGSVPSSDTAEVDTLLRGALEAAPQWMHRSLKDRCALLFRFWELVLEHLDELSLCAARESGKTMAEAQVNFGDSYEFYQAAVLGGSTGLRGYRTERFSGDAALALGGDVRYSFEKINTGLMPLQLGLYGGYDIGRVWFSGEDSSIWHDNIGGGLFLNAIDSLFGDLGVFFGDEGARVSFGFGLAF